MRAKCVQTSNKDSITYLHITYSYHPITMFDSITLRE
jgi:hypothetical protein